jgi:ubiquinone/menaquinone biosynthesis C-methylase UbiE
MSSTPAPDFGRLAAAYDRVRPADENWRRVYDHLVARAGLRAARVLDVGCGTGRLSHALAEEQAARVWGVDVSPEMVAVARAKAPRLRFKEARAEALPFKDDWFDAVVFWLVVHLVDRTAAFAEAGRVLAAGGRVAVVSFHESHFDDYWLNEYFPSLEGIDRARFPTQAGLERELREAGFEPVELERVTGRMSLTRAEAIDKLEQRHISTFDLLPPDEVETGIERARRELPDTIEYSLEFLVAVAQA